jgi:hypothetical protein
VQQGPVQYQLGGMIACVQTVGHLARTLESLSFGHGWIQERAEACHLLDIQAVEEAHSSTVRHSPCDYTPAVTAHLHIEARVKEMPRKEKNTQRTPS